MNSYLSQIQSASDGKALLIVNSKHERLITASTFRKHSFTTKLGCLHSVKMEDITKCYTKVLLDVIKRVNPCDKDLYHDRLVIGSLFVHHNPENGYTIINQLNSNEKIKVKGAITGNASSYNLSRLKHASSCLIKGYKNYVQYS